MSYESRMIGILAAFGIDPKRHLPREGAPSRIIDIPSSYGRRAAFGVRVWINPLPEQLNAPHRRFKSSTHRVMCECPTCGAEMSAGRLHQHIGTARCLTRYARGKIGGRLRRRGRGKDTGAVPVLGV